MSQSLSERADAAASLHFCSDDMAALELSSTGCIAELSGLACDLRDQLLQAALDAGAEAVP